MRPHAFLAPAAVAPRRALARPRACARRPAPPPRRRAPPRRARVPPRLATCAGASQLDGAGGGLAERERPPPPARRGVRAAALAGVVVVAAVANRVAHRLQLTGVMKDYTFFIRLSVTLAYSGVYAAALAARVGAGAVPRSQVRAARGRRHLPALAGAGALEAITFAVQMYAAARLPGVLLGVLGQGVLPFTMLASAVFLGRRYRPVQLLGVACVIAGVLTCTLPTASVAALTGESILLPAALYGFSSAFLACAIVLKERALQGTADGVRFDVFVVNSFASVFQCVTTALMLPITFALANQSDPVQYLADGFHTFLNAPGMPWLTIAYIICNIAFNVANLSLVKEASASAALLANLFSVPLISLVFCLNLPLVTRSPFSWSIIGGLAIIVAGVLLYNRRGSEASNSNSRKDA